MTNYIKSNKAKYWFLIFACVFLWVIATGSKNVYTAEIVEIMGIFSQTRKNVSMGMTFYFITYSSVQMIFSFFMKNVNVKWYILITIFISGGVTILVAFMYDLVQIWWLLAINGVLQAMIWGMCMAVLKVRLPVKMLPIANTLLNIGTAVAGVISYGTASLFVSIERWDLPFIVLGAILSLSAILFFIAVKVNEKTLKEPCDNLKQVVKDKILGENILNIQYLSAFLLIAGGIYISNK